jgi:hypothetical protein
MSWKNFKSEPPDLGAQIIVILYCPEWFTEDEKPEGKLLQSERKFGNRMDCIKWNGTWETSEIIQRWGHFTKPILWMNAPECHLIN